MRQAYQFVCSASLLWKRNLFAGHIGLVGRKCLRRHAWILRLQQASAIFWVAVHNVRGNFVITNRLCWWTAHAHLNSSFQAITNHAAPWCVLHLSLRCTFACRIMS